MLNAGVNIWVRCMRYHPPILDGDEAATLEGGKFADHRTRACYQIRWHQSLPYQTRVPSFAWLNLRDLGLYHQGSHSPSLRFARHVCEPTQVLLTTVLIDSPWHA